MKNVKLHKRILAFVILFSLYFQIIFVSTLLQFIRVSTIFQLVFSSSPLLRDIRSKSQKVIVLTMQSWLTFFSPSFSYRNQANFHYISNSNLFQIKYEASWATKHIRTTSSCYKRMEFPFWSEREMSYTTLAWPIWRKIMTR